MKHGSSPSSLSAAALAVAASTATAGTKGAAEPDCRARSTSGSRSTRRTGGRPLWRPRTATFKAQHPGVDVKIQYQTWSDHLTKFDAALAAGNAPDVIEMGNTEMTKYMAAGAFADS